MFDISLGDGEKQLETITRELRSRRCLIVIDNCEHLIAEASSVVDAIIRACPSITVLATSRERLGLSSELVYRLPPMTSPPATLRSDDGRQYAALELFIARTQAADVHFEFKPDDLQMASDMCRELDGIPLAIELAAARVPLLGLRVSQIRLRDFVAPQVARDRPARHQTMLAALGWSFDLLNDAEQLLLSRTSVFSGGFNLLAAEDVCADEAILVTSIATLIAQLAAKSLIDVSYQESDVRYRLLESVRVFAASKLTERHEAETVSRKHVAWVLACARDVHQKKTPLKPLLQDLDNIRSAVRFCFASVLEDDVVTGADIIGMARHVWYASDRFFELTQLINEALTRVDESKYQRTVGVLLGALGTVLPAAQRAKTLGRAIVLLAETGEISGAAALSAIQAVALQRAGQFEAANTALLEAERFLSLCVGADRERLVIQLEGGWIACEQGRIPEARRRLLEFDRIQKIMMDESVIPMRASLAAEIEAADGNLDAAIAVYCEFYELSRELSALEVGGELVYGCARNLLYASRQCQGCSDCCTRLPPSLER